MRILFPSLLTPEDEPIAMEENPGPLSPGKSGVLSERGGDLFWHVLAWLKEDGRYARKA